MCVKRSILGDMATSIVSPASALAVDLPQPSSPKSITMRKTSAFFTNLDSTTTPT